MNPTQPLFSPFADPFAFVKMHGIGNDFVVLDLIRQSFSADFNFSLFAQTVCDRNFGVGADGLLSLEPSTDGNAARMRMWNPDGSEDMCGNGLRCVALLAFRRGYTPRECRVQTLSGPRGCQILDDEQVRVSMGAPDFSPTGVPLNRTQPLVEGTLELEGQIFNHVTSLSTGSTHTVIFSDEPVGEEKFQRWSPKLEIAPMFPDRTSVLWAHALGENRFGIRIWERGVGETLACGTGACAVAVAARVTKRARGLVEVISRGGTLNIEWDETSGEIWKSGPATEVFEGVWTR